MLQPTSTTQLLEKQERTGAVPLSLPGVPTDNRLSEMASTPSDARIKTPLGDVSSASSPLRATLLDVKPGTLRSESDSAVAPPAPQHTASAGVLLPVSANRTVAPDSTTAIVVKPSRNNKQRSNSEEVRHGVLPSERQRIGHRQEAISSPALSVLPLAQGAPKLTSTQVVLSAAASKPVPKANQLAIIPLDTPNSLTTYPIAHGHHVRFEKQVGRWVAQVQDVWGRVQHLPVLCAPHQTPERAIAALSGKALGDYKYCIHILDTNQPPWAPKAVYVGALGLRGGGNVGSIATKAVRFVWGVVSSIPAAVAYLFKENIPPLPCRVAVSNKSETDDLRKNEVDNNLRVDGKWVTFRKDSDGYWWARMSRFKHNYTMVGDLCYREKSDTTEIPVKSRRSVSLSLEDLVNCRFSIRKYRKKSFEGFVEYTFHDYNDYEGMGYELELLTSPEEIHSNKEARLRKRREQKKAAEREAQKREEAVLRRAAEERKQAAIRRLEEEKRKEAEARAQAEAKAREALQQKERDASLKRMAANLTQRHSRAFSHDYAVVAAGYLSDDELDHNLETNTGSKLDPGGEEEADLSSDTLAAGQHQGIPNTGNTCYMNSVLQATTRLYPDLFGAMEDELGHRGQDIAHKLTNKHTGTRVTEGDARIFYGALRNSYNQHHEERLNIGAQEDAAPVLNFLLDRGKVQKLALHPTTVDPKHVYDPRTSNTANHDALLSVNFPVANQTPSGAPLSMDALVAAALRGNTVEDFIWEQDADKEIRGEAIAGNRLSVQNLHGLTNHILPVWVHRFKQTSNHDANSAAKITTPIADPFKLTITPDYLIDGEAPYTSNLVGFILQTGGLHAGHYTAYVKNLAGRWIKYDDKTVTALDEAPLSEAQAAYLYFYQAEGEAREGLPGQGPTIEAGRSSGNTAQITTPPCTIEALEEQLQQKETYARSFNEQAHVKQEEVGALFQNTVDSLKACLDATSTDFVILSNQQRLLAFHEKLLAFSSALEGWTQHLQDWGRTSDDWASNLRQLPSSTKRFALNTYAYENMLGHYQTAQATLSRYQVLFQDIISSLDAPDYYAALTTPQLRRQGLSLAHAWRPITSKAAAEKAHTLREAEQAYQSAKSRNEKAQDKLAIARQQWVRKQVVVMAHALNHAPLLAYFSGQGREYINEQDDQGKTALWHAIDRGEPVIVQWLLDHGAAPEDRDADRCASLHWAATKGHVAIAELLLEKGADIKAKGGDGFTPLHYAVEADHQAMTKLLLNRGACLDARDEWHSTPLHRAALKGHVNTAALLLEQGATTEAKDIDDCTPLHFAVQEGHVDMVELLLVHGADRKACNKDGLTPLHCAVQLGHLATTKVLLYHVADVKSQDTDRSTLLHRAAQQSNKAIVQLLLARGATIDARDDDRCTPLHRAAQQGHVAVVETLLTRGAAINAQDANGFTPLHWAVEQSHSIVVELLLVRGASLIVRDIHGKTPRDLAAATGHQLEDLRRKELYRQVKAMAHATRHWPLLRYFDGRGAQYINTPDSQGKTALWYAIDQGELAIVAWLLDHGADIEAKHLFKFTALHQAVNHGHTDIVELLLARGANTEVQDKWGRTPLHRAVFQAHIATIKLLLTHGANIKAKSESGTTPLDLAVARGHNALAALLRAAQAPAPTSSHRKAETTSAPKGPAAAATVSALQQRLKDAPALVQAKSALRVAEDRHKKAQEAVEASAQALQEAQTGVEHAKEQSREAVLRLQAMQQYMTQLSQAMTRNASTEPHRVALYLQPIIKDAQDYLQTLSEADEEVSEEHKERGNALLATLYGWQQQERQYYRHVEQLFLGGGPLSKVVQVQLLGEILPRHQYHIDTLGDLIKKFVKAGHMAEVADTVPPPAANVSTSRKKAPLHEGTTVQEETALQRIAQLGQSLPAYLRKAFQEKVVPILKEKLSLAPTALQAKVFHYFQQRGTFYPTVLRQHPVEAWVLMSLFQELAQGITAPSEATHLRFNLLVSKLQAQYSADVLTEILWALQDKKVAHSLSLEEICDILDMLPQEGVRAQRLLHFPDAQWMTMLKKDWLQEAISSHCSQLSMDQRQQLVQALAFLDWDLQMTQTFLEQLPPAYDAGVLGCFLAFVAQHPIDDGELLQILSTPASSQKDVIAHWHHQVACCLLQEKLPNILPQEAQKSTYDLVEALWLHVPAYRAVGTFLDQLFLRQEAEDDFTLDIAALHSVLTMIRDYRLDDAAYTALLQQLLDLPTAQWSSHFYTQIMQCCFAGEARERTVEEIIEYMATHSPGVAYLQDRAKVRQDYQAVLTAYQGDSTLCPENSSIASWEADTITQWAKEVRRYAKDPAQGTLPTQAERMAVVKRAVELCHGFPPRSTQLLSVLVLLNTEPNKGRLLQQNTGEGKSLTVAMFSAIKALLDNKSDIVTTSIELSIPEVTKQRPFFEMLALSVAENSDENTQGGKDKKKKYVYQQDQVYGTPKNFQGDILRQEFFGQELRTGRPFDCVVVDEVDSMLFDSRTHSIRLSSGMPATNHLGVLLAATWQQVNYWSSRLMTDHGKVYCITEDFYKDEHGNITILSGEERDPKKCMIPIEESVEEFIRARAQYYLELLLRDLETDDEKAAYADHKRLERKIALQRLDVANAKEPDNYKAEADTLKKLEEEQAALPWNADRKKYPPIIVVPAHLKAFAKRQVPKWIRSAIMAALGYKQDHQFSVKDGDIAPVDYTNTGVLQQNMVWSNGLAQFLQMKHGLKVKPESISTNFISTAGFFQRYARQLYGLTGTLGNETTRAFFRQVYHTDLVVVPPYKQRLIVGNEESRYACKELTPQIIVDKDTNKWYDAIEASVLQHAQQQRAVLVICKYIRQVHDLRERLQQRYTRDKIFTYTGKEQFTKDRVYPGEIVIATNIAGRGTDLTPDAVVEHHGGLHVCITFLPNSYRVELQNAGRTARKGGKGTAQLILHQTEPVTIEALRQQRDEREAKDLQAAIDEVGRMTFKDELFQRFCQLENKLIPTLDGLERMRQSQLAEQLWEAYAQDAYSPEVLREHYEGHIDNLVQAKLDAIPAAQWNSLSRAGKQARKATIAQTVRADNSFSEFQKKYTRKARKEAIQEFQKTLGSEDALHQDVVKAFEEGRKYVPENGALAFKYGWGPFERKAVEERFGLWFHEHVPQGKGAIDADKIKTSFEAFLKEIEADAQANNLIQNPFFYVQKGNNQLQSPGTLDLRSVLWSSRVKGAIDSYDKAIALDPDFSLHARYNKAIALLKPKKNKKNHEAAKKELKEAKLLINRYKDDLITFQGTIGLAQPPKPHTAQHLQHHLDILAQQERHIDAAVGVIALAQNARKGKGNHVKITQLVEVDGLFDKDSPAESHEKALAESYENGLAYFFTIEEKKPKPWLSICAVALIGLVQIAAAVVATVVTAGLATQTLLQSGISDIMKAITSSITGKFSWKEWGISKAIQIGVAIVSAGIQSGWSSLKGSLKEFRTSLKDGYKSLKDGVVETKAAVIKQVKEVALEIGKGVGSECAAILLNQGVQEVVGEALEEKITDQVSSALMEFMLKSELIKKAMAHDAATGRDYWSQIFIKEGLAMLNEKDSDLHTILKGIVQGTALQQITEGIHESFGGGSSKAAILSRLASTGSQMLSGFLTDIHGFTDKFLANFDERIQQKYGEELNNIATKAKSTTKEKQKSASDADKEQAPVEQAFMYVMDAQDHFDEDELQLHDRHNGQAFSTQAQMATPQAPIDPKANQEERTKALGNALTNNVSAQLLGKVNQHLITPLTSMAAGAFMDFATSGITERWRAQRNAAVMASNATVHENKHANQQAGQQSTHQHSTPVGVTSDAPNATPLNPEATNNVSASTSEGTGQTGKKQSYQEADLTELGAYASETGMAIKIVEGGRSKGYIGTKNKGNGIAEVEYIKNPTPTDNNHGHWVAKVNGQVIDLVDDGSGLCLANSLVASMPAHLKEERGIHTGQDLYNAVAKHRSDHPAYARQSDRHYLNLLRHNPDALMRGAGVWADAAQALQTMDDFVAQHPQLASLLSNAGAMAGGAMWLKNLTPSGIASYLLTNYGYNKIIELAGGSLEKGKAYLAQFFVKHDEDITQEQATYLANFTMHVLTDVGGRVAFHHAAAKGWQKVGRRGKGGK